MNDFDKNDLIQYTEKATEISDIVSIEYVDQGISSDVFRVETAKGLIIFLRFVNENENASLEFGVYKKLRDLGVKVPKPIYYEDFAEHFGGRSFMILGKLDGMSLSDRFVDKEILYEAAQDLRKVHSIKIEKFGSINRGIDAPRTLTGFKDSYKEYCLNNLEDRIKNIVENSLLSTEKSEQILSYIIQKQELLDVSTSHLIHGDLNPEHIFSNDNKYSGIIDFGDMKGASRYHDLVNYWFTTDQHYQDLEDGYFLNHKRPENFDETMKLERLVFVIRKIDFRLKNRPESIPKRIKKFNEAINAL
jgi:Ser/Thr protein kinase RdoA (MazF antagonist)